MAYLIYKEIIHDLDDYKHPERTNLIVMSDLKQAILFVDSYDYANDGFDSYDYGNDGVQFYGVTYGDEKIQLKTIRDFWVNSTFKRIRHTLVIEEIEMA